MNDELLSKDIIMGCFYYIKIDGMVIVGLAISWLINIFLVLVNSWKEKVIAFNDHDFILLI
ncbi:hypothetical protein B738_07339 [Photorhabdus temperata subsp. temperata M1021]|uniref:Uncharacterized protein n=1 Tax=Photorhabdus temperata J3 TaxID=1389415 RepID=U7R6Q9_PHOTE|nr:hypothetical protein B738_07339 [Photorhabdus temperata subsp. temperata M1021]ERT14466.1 hypothetical protein O185_03625 [Photorhabdus temperata J3]